MISITNIAKGFSDKPVIEGVSAEFETGKCNLIIGASGSGKTVLMKCLVGLITPDAGEIMYDGENFSHMNDEAKKIMRRKIATLLLPLVPVLFPASVMAAALYFIHLSGVFFPWFVKVSLGGGVYFLVIMILFKSEVRVLLRGGKL